MPRRILTTTLLIFVVLASAPQVLAFQDDPERQRAFALYRDAQWIEALPLFEKLAVRYPEDPAIAEALGLLLQHGAITADPQLETWLRERYDLPEIDEEFTKKPPTQYGLPAPGSPDAPASQGGDPANAPEPEPAAAKGAPAPAAGVSR